MFIGRESKVRRAYDSGPDHDALIKAYNLYLRDGGSYDKDGNKIIIRYCAQKFGVSTSALVRRINGNVNLEASLGRHSLLSKEEESLLVNHLLK